MPQAWLDGYEPDAYGGVYRSDGAKLMVDTINSSEETVTVLCIGPASTTAQALAMAPAIAVQPAKARFVGMHGAVRFGYRGSTTPVPEYNVFIDVPAFRTVLDAPWPITLLKGVQETPLDTCGIVTLEDDEYALVHDAQSPLMRAVMANYRAWAEVLGRPELAERRSTRRVLLLAVPSRKDSPIRSPSTSRLRKISSRWRPFASRCATTD